MADWRKSPPFVWCELAPKRFLVQRLVIGRATGYRAYCTTTTEAKAQHLVEVLSADGPEHV